MLGRHSIKHHRYNVLKVLGQTPTNLVRLCEHKETGERVIIKSCPRTHAHSAAHEAHVTVLAAHPNVVSLQDFFISYAFCHLLLKPVEVDLERVMVDTLIPLTGLQIKSMMRDILTGVAHIHSKFIIHRDIKPANIFVSLDCRAQIGDFGLAGIGYSLMTNRTYATRWYRAPELLQCNQTHDSAVDVWAVGCIFAELLSSNPGARQSNHRPLYPGRNTAEQRDLVARGSVTRMSLAKWIGYPVDSTAVDLLARLLVHQPRHRISAAAALQHSYFVLERPLKEVR